MSNIDNEKDLSERKNPRFWNELYIDMLANPFDRRTDKQFCEELSMSISNLEQWKKRYRRSIFEEVQKRRNSYLNEMRTMLWKSLAKKMNSAKGTDPEKLIAQMLGDLVEKHESKVEMSDADKLRRIRTLREGFKNRSKVWEDTKTSQEGSGDSGPGTQELGGS